MKSLNLSIPKPCTEEWENFTPAENGRFCSSCSKVIVDFTKMSDGEILEYLKSKTSHSCGRFRPDQLKRYDYQSMPGINPGFTLVKAGLLGLLLLLVSRPSSAQTVSPKAKIEIVDQKGSRDSTGPREQTLKGVVLAEDNEPLAGASVVLKGSAVATVADAEGKFEFPQKVKEGDVIVFSFIGFGIEEYVVRKSIQELVEIRMRCDYEVLGEVAVEEVYTEKPSGLHQVWTKVKNLF